MTNKQLWRWVKALRRTGRTQFQQGRGALLADPEYDSEYREYDLAYPGYDPRTALHCCLAVYQAVNEPNTDWAQKCRYPHDSAFPEPLKDVFVTANDEEHKNFFEIADLAVSLKDKLVTA